MDLSSYSFWLACKPRVKTGSASSIPDIEDLPRVSNRGRLATEFSSDVSHGLNKLIIALRRLSIRQEDVVLKPNADDVAPHKDSDSVHGKLVAPRRQYFPSPVRKQACPVLRGEREGTHSWHHCTETEAVIEPEVSRIAFEYAFVSIAIELVDLTDLGDLELERGAPLQYCLDVLLEQVLGIYVGHRALVPALWMVEVPGSSGDRKEILLWLQLVERKPLLVIRPDKLVRVRIASHAESIGCLDQNVAFVPDPFDDLAEHADIAGRSFVGRARMDVHHRCPRLVALMRRFSDFCGRDRHLGADPVLLRAAVDGGENDELLCSGQVLLLVLTFSCWLGRSGRHQHRRSQCCRHACILSIRACPLHSMGIRSTSKLKVRHETAALRDFGAASDGFGTPSGDEVRVRVDCGQAMLGRQRHDWNSSHRKMRPASRCESKPDGIFGKDRSIETSLEETAQA